MSKKVLLKDAVPDIEKYWDSEKNTIPLETLGASSSEKVWTFCPICGNSIPRNVRFTWEKGTDGVGHVIHCRTCGKRNDDNSLVNCFPDIKKYWDYDQNTNPPEYYAVSSGKKVYVKCPECGESKYRAVCDTVNATPDGSYKLSICRECLNLPKIKRHFRKGLRLKECCPDITRLWIYEKNSCAPEELTPYSREQIYIKCPLCGDELHRSCFNAFRKEGDTFVVVPCHKCGISKAVKEKAYEKPISVMFPDIYTWWDPDNNSLEPEEISHRSKYHASFVCPECHKPFKRPIRSFITVHKDGSYLPVGCPSCGFAPRENPENNLLKVCPEIADWWDYEKNYPHVPEEYTAGSQNDAYLRCPDCGMELFTGIHSLVETLKDGTVKIRHKGKCRKYKALDSENNIVKNYPDIVRWWDYEKNYPHLPEEYTLFSPLSAHFKCPDCGAETERRITDAFALVDDNTPQIFKCPYCADKKVLPGMNDLKTRHPELMNRWLYVENSLIGIFPEQLLSSSNDKAWWKCPDCDYRYMLPISDMVLKGKRGHNPCPRCTGRRWSQIHFI